MIVLQSYPFYKNLMCVDEQTRGTIGGGEGEGLCHGPRAETDLYRTDTAVSGSHFTLSAPNTTNDVLSNSPKWYPYFLLKKLGRISLLILDSLQYVIYSYILTTKQLVLF